NPRVVRIRLRHPPASLFPTGRSPALNEILLSRAQPSSTGQRRERIAISICKCSILTGFLGAERWIQTKIRANSQYSGSIREFLTREWFASDCVIRQRVCFLPAAPSHLTKSFSPELNHRQQVKDANVSPFRSVSARF